MSQNFKPVFDGIYNFIDTQLVQQMYRGAVPTLARMPKNPDGTVKAHVVVRFGSPVAESRDRSVAVEQDQMNRATVTLHCIGANADVAESVASFATSKIVGYSGTDHGPLSLLGGGGMGDVLDDQQKPQASIFTVMMSFHMNIGNFE